MSNRPQPRISLSATLLFAVSILGADTIDAKRLPAPPVSRRPASPMATAAADTALLGTWDFEGPGGAPDPQGWTPLDESPQVIFGHVDDFAGLPTPYAPLEGTKSFWIGARPGGPVVCGYATLPGYGNNWSQRLQTGTLSTTGDVTIDFKARWDSEPSYDGTYVQYLSKTGTWRSLGSWLTYQGEGVETRTVPEDSIAGSTRIRFWFRSDGAWSDQGGIFPTDGAIEIDSLTVSDATGVLDYQDFEAEAIGATETVDGHWTAHGLEAFGDYAALFDGDTIVQGDSLTFNHSNVWGFFNGSTSTLACMGHPEQATPPGPHPTDPTDSWTRSALNDVARSPDIDLRTDVDGQPVPWAAQNLVIDYDIYGDELPYPYHIQHKVEAIFLIDGCWRTGGYYGSGTGTETGGPLDQQMWVHRTSTIAIPAGATKARVMLGAAEASTAFFLAEHCHTVYPLFDNVEVRAATDFTTAAGTTPAATHLDQNVPNPFNPTTTIGYSIASAGRVSLVVYDVGGRRVRVLVDAFQRPDAGPFRVDWDGRNDAGVTMSSGVYFYRLTASGVTETRKMLLLK